LSVKYDIRSEYLRTNSLKVIIFFENLVKPLSTNEESDIEKNKKIDESKIVYSFFRGLVANGKCQLNKYREAIRILGLEKLRQEKIDKDYSMNDFVTGLILDYYLTPFIEEYKNYL
jgi:hypothetical protein